MGDGDGGQLDLFTVTAIDPPWRDNRDAMGYPFLSLQKRRTTPIEFEQNEVSVGVYAHPKFGLATIWDWDLMIFAASHINEAIESRRKISSRVTFVPHDCLKQIARPIGGEHYRRLADAIRRLAATLVITNIRIHDQPDKEGEAGFHWLTGYWIPKRYRRYRTAPNGVTYITPHDPDGEPDPVRSWEIELHPWLYNAIVRQGDILAVHPDYFQLTGGLERWLYRLARKAVPDKAEPPAIRFKMETLHARSGATRDLRHFACDIRAIAETQPLPEYGITIEPRRGQRELVTLYRDFSKPCRPPRGRRLKTIRGEHVEPAVNTDAYLQPEDVFVIDPTPEPVTPPTFGLTDAGRELLRMLEKPPEIREEELRKWLRAAEAGPSLEERIETLRARIESSLPTPQAIAPEDLRALEREAGELWETACHDAVDIEVRCPDDEAKEEARRKARAMCKTILEEVLGPLDELTKKARAPR